MFNAVEAGFRGVTSAVGASVDEFIQQQQVAAQTTAVLKFDRRSRERDRQTG